MKVDKTLSDKRPPTTRDLAKDAGVSMATVDRVLNNRTGVREPTRRKVEDAIARLGYKRNEAASTMAKGRIHNFAVLLPSDLPCFADRIEQIAREINVLIERHFAHLDCIRIVPKMLCTTLHELQPDRLEGLILFVDIDNQSWDRLRELEAKGTRIVSLIQPGLEHLSLPETDLEAHACGEFAGHLIGKLAKLSAEAICLAIPEDPTNQDLRCAYAFEAVIARTRPNVAAVEKFTLGHDRSTNLKTGIGGIYFLIGSTSDAVTETKALGGEGSLLVCQGFNSSILKALSAGKIDAIVCRDFHGQIAEALSRLSAVEASDFTKLQTGPLNLSVLWSA